MNERSSLRSWWSRRERKGICSMLLEMDSMSAPRSLEARRRTWRLTNLESSLESCPLCIVPKGLLLSSAQNLALFSGWIGWPSSTSSRSQPYNGEKTTKISWAKYKSFPMCKRMSGNSSSMPWRSRSSTLRNTWWRREKTETDCTSWWTVTWWLRSWTPRLVSLRSFSNTSRRSTLERFLWWRTQCVRQA